MERFLNERDFIDIYGCVPTVIKNCVEGSPEYAASFARLLQLHERVAGGEVEALLHVLRRYVYEAGLHGKNGDTDEQKACAMLGMELHAREYCGYMDPDPHRTVFDERLRERVKRIFDDIGEADGSGREGMAVFYDVEKLQRLEARRVARWRSAHAAEIPEN